MKLILEKFTTSEFWTTALAFGVGVYLMWHSTGPLGLHAVGLTILLSGYMIGRSFHKHMKAASHIKGVFTSEFYFMIAGLGSFVYFVRQERLSEGWAVILGSILVCAYVLARGNAKRISARPVPFL